jgi:hypothetical protein
MTSHLVFKTGSASQVKMSEVVFPTVVIRIGHAPMAYHQA